MDLRPWPPWQTMTVVCVVNRSIGVTLYRSFLLTETGITLFYSQREQKHGPACKYKALWLVLLLKIGTQTQEVMPPFSHHKLRKQCKGAALAALIAHDSAMQNTHHACKYDMPLFNGVWALKGNTSSIMTRHDYKAQESTDEMVSFAHRGRRQKV